MLPGNRSRTGVEVRVNSFLQSGHVFEGPTPVILLGSEPFVGGEEFHWVEFSSSRCFASQIRLCLVEKTSTPMLLLEKETVEKCRNCPLWRRKRHVFATPSRIQQHSLLCDRNDTYFSFRSASNSIPFSGGSASLSRRKRTCRNPR